jgi:heme oxygenase (biliverdin-IX-beta and delta-forming)
MTDNVHLQLRSATRAQHEALEDRLGLLDDNIDRVVVISVLRMFATVYAELEAQIDVVMETSTLNGELQWSRRRKSALLTKDLTFFDVQPKQVVVPVVVKGEASMLGCMYVMEGATLGARIIKPHLHERLGVDEGLSFFDAYGDDGPAMWKQFRGVLSALEDIESAIAGASSTFDVFLGSI